MSSGGGAGPLVATFHGFVHNSMDGLILFEACLNGKLHHVPRRPHDRERASLIKSGSIFIYEENASGIKRWTDGVAWSPSRILGNFLIYRELEKPFPPGEKKRAMKRKRASLPGEPYPRRDSDDHDAPEMTAPLTPPEPTGGDVKAEIPSTDQDKELERSLIGSLVDSYGFRPDGLVKKTMSISVNGISHHMVSYYKVDDVKNHLLPRPLSDPRLTNITVRPELYLKQNFRAPVEETEHYAVDGHMNAHPQMMYTAVSGHPYTMRNGPMFSQQQYPGMYGLATTSSASVYGGMTGTSWPTAQPASMAGLPYGGHQAYAGQPYGGYYKGAADTNAASTVKSEAPSASTPSMSYSSHYAPSYPTMQRSGSQSGPSMMHSSYATPVPSASSSTFGSMSAGGGRPSYGGSSIHSPTSETPQHPAPAPPHPIYGTGAAQPYAVRSPTQPYTMQSAPQSAVAQSPHPSVKSPQSAHPGTPAQSIGADPTTQLQSAPMSYRSGSYGGVSHSAHSTADMNGLGISTGSAYSTSASNGQSYNYSSSGPAYRSMGNVTATAQTAGYAS